LQVLIPDGEETAFLTTSSRARNNASALRGVVVSQQQLRSADLFWISLEGTSPLLLLLAYTLHTYPALICIHCPTASSVAVCCYVLHLPKNRYCFQWISGTLHLISVTLNLISYREKIKVEQSAPLSFDGV